MPAAAAPPAPERSTGFGKALLGLALPVLPVLAAEPVYLLVDGIVVGHVGQLDLAALGVGSLLVLLLGTQMNFLSYGTTARAARCYGAGRTDRAIGEGLQATWVALGVGVVIVAALSAALGPILGVLTPDAQVAAAAERWVRIAACGIPLILISAAGHGWLRGVQRTREPLLFVVGGISLSAVLCIVLVPGLGPIPALGLTGSAWANLTGQAATATGMLVTLLRGLRAHGLSLRPRPSIIGQQLTLGANLIVRTAAFQIVYFAATRTAADTGNATVGAHHLAGQLWSLVSLILDSVAIAAQALVGQALGASDRLHARRYMRAATWWSLGIGVVLAAIIASMNAPLIALLTSDDAVAAQLRIALLAIAVLCIPAAIVFGLDGVLLGAGDAAFLRTLTIITALGGYLPVLLATDHFRWGLVGIWSGMATFILGRLIGVVWRARGEAWTQLGAPQKGHP